MLQLVDESNRSSYGPLLDEMHKLRARVFHDRLHWDVEISDDREVDTFDAANPLYILSINEETGHVDGSVRLLPTTGPNMLRDVFSVLLPDGLVVESPVIWESSRFCIDPDIARDNPTRINHITVELLLGLTEAGLRAGLSHIVSVYDARMVRIFRACNCPAETIGTPTRIGRVMTYAGLFEISDALWQSIAATADITDQLISGWRPFAGLAA